MSVMGGLLAGNAPLRGRANLELVIRPFDYPLAARYWEVADPQLAPIRRFTTSLRVDEIWSIRHNLTPYDACYVVLARQTGAALLTLDKHLMHAPALGIPLFTIHDEGTSAE